ncbi:Vacuolar protein sorting-associated protein 62 [Vigna unguiculata]|uniref:Vacuolar protein sorting-associated protein 62 n=1 Tax=Vigna unguiculata TaxID=3917 RepID=A0A4D6M4S6_VIGUN|nr:Vacuolar protein sorting-associated protein 62 [Vigna unguiculata]
MGNSSNKALPIDTTFKLPANLPLWPQGGGDGGGFATGTITIGGLKLFQISTFNRVWTTLEGGPGDAGATFFEPAGIPEGFFILGHYSQPNNKPLFGSVLVAKDEPSSGSNEALKKPVDYTLVWSSKSKKIKQDKDGYVWLPTAPDGYKALGHVVTTTSEKPSLDKIRCVRTDLTEQCEINSWIWGPDKSNDGKGFGVHEVRPSNRGIEAPGVVVGTFFAHNGETPSSLPIACLKNPNMEFSSMPNLTQIKALLQAYSPFMYLHPKEKFQPASVKWYFSNGALLFKKGAESKPVAIDPTGSNLPQGGSNDGEYWLDLPADKANKERVKKGDFKSFQAYVHAKPMFGGTFTDLAMWVFYPFNGPGTAKVGLIDIPLGVIGEHIGDWEHVTLRVSNFNGELKKVYVSQHSSGEWVEAPQLEFQSGNKPVIYSSLNGHAIYAKEGVVMQGLDGAGLKNESAKSDKVVDLGSGFEIVAGEYLGSAIVEPPWLNYLRQWGPKISYDTAKELDKLEKVFPALDSLQRILPNELFGEEGPTGPKLKRNWSGDEV